MLIYRKSKNENHVQMCATKLIHGFKELSYSKRLKKLKFTSYRVPQGDAIELFKMLDGKYSRNACIKSRFVDEEVSRTRGKK